MNREIGLEEGRKTCSVPISDGNQLVLGAFRQLLGLLCLVCVTHSGSSAFSQPQDVSAWPWALRYLGVHRMVWIGKDLRDHVVLTLLLRAGLPAATSDIMAQVLGVLVLTPAMVLGLEGELLGQPLVLLPCPLPTSRAFHGHATYPTHACCPRPEIPRTPLPPALELSSWLPWASGDELHLALGFALIYGAGRRKEGCWSSVLCAQSCQFSLLLCNINLGCFVRPLAPNGEASSRVFLFNFSIIL